jgi:nucleotide-binding universal stress UspA family protein
VSPVTIKRILCPVDFSEFSAMAYEYASSLARHYRAALFVQHVVEIWRHTSASFAATADLYDSYCQQVRSEREEQLRKFVDELTRIECTPVCVVAQGGFASDCILSFADEQTIDLIVMGTHGRRGLDRVMLGSVTERVLRESRCPVLCVHKSGQKIVASGDAQPFDLRCVLFCTDFSGDSNRALEYALSLAAEYHSELVLVHVAESSAIHRGIEQSLRIKLERDLRKLVAIERNAECKISTIVRVGRAYKEIIQVAAEREADLVIMAVRGRNALDLAVFGSTTYRVIQLGGCPVLAVKV